MKSTIHDYPVRKFKIKNKNILTTSKYSYTVFFKFFIYTLQTYNLTETFYNQIYFIREKFLKLFINLIFFKILIQIL